eukprot:14294761-Ditylum_brightwellii.AAC.1
MLEKLILVRLYLEVLTLTDIMNNNGTEIEPWALTGTKQAGPSLPWLNQERPLKICWITWRCFLKQHFCVDTAKNHRLNKPLQILTYLGQWLTATPYTTRNYYFIPSTKSIIKYRNREFTEYTKAAGWLIIYVRIGIVPTLPDDAIQMKANELGPFLLYSSQRKPIHLFRIHYHTARACPILYG